MCMGSKGGTPKTAEQYYQEMKPNLPELPSLRDVTGNSPVERKSKKLKDVPKVREGSQARSSLLNMSGEY